MIEVRRREKRQATWLLPAALGLSLGLFQTQRAQADEVIHPWQGLGEGFIASYRWPSVLWHVSAVAVTPPLVWTSDAPVQEWTQKHETLGQTFAQTTLIVGGVTPVLVPLGLYLGGLAGDAHELATAGAAALQAAAVQAVIITTLKWLTDRKGPYPDGDPTRSRELSGILRDSKDPKDFNFNPFDLAGGLRWPSGHTASNIAIVSALVAFYPDLLWLPAIGYPLALAVALGMIEGDYHWLSDVIAGALMGHAIGWAIGRNFRARYDAERARSQSGERPVVTAEATFATLSIQSGFGLSFGGRF